MRRWRRTRRSSSTSASSSATSSQYEAGLKAPVGQYAGQRGDLPDPHRGRDRRRQLLGGRTSYQNAGKTLRRGFELGLESELSEHWNANSGLYPAIRHLRFGFQGRRQDHRQGQAPAGRAGKQPVRRTGVEARGGHQHGLEGMYRSQVYVEDSNSEKAAPSYAVFNWRTRFEQRLGPGPSTSWCAWTTCSTASTSARSSSATATGVT